MGDSEVDGDGASPLAEAEAALCRGSPDLCLALLQLKAGGGPSGRDDLPNQQRRRLQLQAICRIQLADKGGSWWEVLGLAASECSASDVKRQAKRLSAVVHPDKCRLPWASEAFTQLQRGADALLRSLDGAPTSSGRKRARRGDEPGPAPARPGGSDGNENEESDLEYDCMDQDFPWWSQWDDPSAPRGPAAAAAADNGANDASEQQAAKGAQDAASLRCVDIDALREEVRRRQDAMLDPHSAAALQPGDPPPSLHSLRAALLRARTILSERLQAADQQDPLTTLGGGFLPGT